MVFTHLTTKQAETLRQRIGPILRFLARCRQRLSDLNVDPNSDIHKAVVKAHDAVHSLHITAHYASISHGVGKPLGDDEPTVDSTKP
jgi:hypothetical protein